MLIELMLRFMHSNKVKAVFLKRVTIMMQIGGASNKNYSNRVKGLLSDLKAMRNNGILFPFITLLLKPLRKIVQYF
ncbi:MAG: glycosyltransferase [Mucilaginibacter sp.]|nr:glycosyltransferase [Mucilaginibacter sp.]